VRAAAFIIALSAGCASSTLYRWGDYDEALYQHYRHPEDRQQFVESLTRIILDNEQRGARMPPGAYAEYGWALYEEGRGPDAIKYFEKESALWPESRVLMQKMIAVARRSRGPATKGPAGAAEPVIR
jgi:hypothetical protein